MKRPSLAQLLVTRLQDVAQGVRVNSLDERERKAVLRLFYEIARSDGSVSAEEQQGMEALARKLLVSWAAVNASSIEDAVAQLAKSPFALKLACLVVADAVFADGDYDDAEKKFVGSFKERFNLPENPLREAVEALRKQKFDAALEDWNREILNR